jgi:hypothetical protein
MKLTAVVLSLLSTLMLWAQSASTERQQKPEELAQKSAEAWLPFTDSGEYGESSEQAASAFKSAVSKDQWIHALTTVRTPLGKVASRVLKSATFKTSLPNAAAGA